ncbi:MAG TPA: YwiC-like family protein, partial [Candidatus Sulfotelmatobacter sp.]|nr:YwiC-like family protein [Candidatus Sulfotelmatobacter sp.]
MVTEVEHTAGEALQSTVADDATERARRERNRALIVPREHGAWGLLLVPMVTAAGVAFRESTNVFGFVLLLTAALSLFWLRTPLESLL